MKSEVLKDYKINHLRRRVLFKYQIDKAKLFRYLSCFNNLKLNELNNCFSEYEEYYQ
jgi:hypothetical protein